MDKRILRNYRGMSPARFYALNRRTRKGLAKLWGTSLAALSPTVKAPYEDASDQHDEAYHEALLGSIVARSRRDLLQVQIVGYLDEIAVTLEGAGYYDPEVLLVSGFDLAKERRGRPRQKGTPPASIGIQQSNVEKDGSDPASQ
jgi:hypothetical protein